MMRKMEPKKEKKPDWKDSIRGVPVVVVVVVVVVPVSCRSASHTPGEHVMP